MRKSSRTKLLDRKHNIRDAKLFVIATEGSETEKQYFQIFHDSRIKIEVLSTGDNNDSAPEYVIERLNEFVQKYDLGKGDTLCLMIDVDRWGQKKLSSICSQAKQKKYYLAVSNPCFEVWLYLHINELETEDIEQTKCRYFEDKLRVKLGSYNKSNLDLDIFKEFINQAVERAKKLHPNYQQHWPPTVGTHAYRIVELILKVIK